MYNQFKRLDKYTLKYTDRGLEKHPQSPTLHHLKNEKDNNYSIWLTKCNDKNCDIVKIISYDPDGNIQDSKFEFSFFDYENNKRYLITIFYEPGESGFFGNPISPACWIIEVREESTPEVLRDIRGEGTSESEDVENILHDSNNDFRRKILSLIENFKYNRVVIHQENLSLNCMGGVNSVAGN